MPAEFGGNMDAPEVSVGNTLYLPVNVSGALLYMGGGHAAMGDGEVAGTAIEVPVRTRLLVSVVKGSRVAWPEPCKILDFERPQFESSDLTCRTAVPSFRHRPDCLSPLERSKAVGR